MTTKRKTKPKTAEPKSTAVHIKPPHFEVIEIKIEGTAPYVQHNFSKGGRSQMLRAQMETGAKNKRKKEPRDPEAEVKASTHYAQEGWVGIPAPAFRNAMIDACRLVGYKMTMAKMTVFVDADGLDAVDGTPLVRLIAGKPERAEHVGRLGDAKGTAMVVIRPMWRKWGAVVRMRFDADQFSVSDVTNLMARAGLQIGIGEGRPYSKRSNGMGWGTFRIV